MLVVLSIFGKGNLWMSNGHVQIIITGHLGNVQNILLKHKLAYTLRISVISSKTTGTNICSRTLITAYLY